MYHMTRGYDESSRLVTEPVASSSAPNLISEDDIPPVDIRPSVYGSLDNSVNALSNAETDPLLTESEIEPKGNPRV